MGKEGKKLISVSFKCSLEEKQHLEKEAQDANMSVSKFVRQKQFDIDTPRAAVTSKNLRGIRAGISQISASMATVSAAARMAVTTFQECAKDKDMKISENYMSRLLSTLTELSDTVCDNAVKTEAFVSQIPACFSKSGNFSFDNKFLKPMNMQIITVVGTIFNEPQVFTTKKHTEMMCFKLLTQNTKNQDVIYNVYSFHPETVNNYKKGDLVVVVGNFNFSSKNDNGNIIVKLDIYTKEEIRNTRIEAPLASQK